MTDNKQIFHPVDINKKGHELFRLQFGELTPSLFVSIRTTNEIYICNQNYIWFPSVFLNKYLKNGMPIRDILKAFYKAGWINA